MQNQPKDNKIPFPKQSGFRRIEINLNTIFVVIGAILLIILAFNFFNSGNNGTEISINSFVSNIKDNKYSVVNIQDDGKAVALGKTFLTSNSDSKVQFNDQKINFKKLNTKR